MKIRYKRSFGFALIILIYLFASAIGAFLYAISPFPYWLSLLIADVFATGFVYLFSSIFQNASVYDPYWSVAPVVIVALLLLEGGVTFYGALLSLCIILWGVRLTANWAYTFHGLKYQDWRYTNLEKTTGAFYPLVNLVGIHTVPTLVVWGCILPAVHTLVLHIDGNIGAYLSLTICVLAIALELVADIQIQRYRKNRTTPFIREGLWKYSRHPNYLGEILMWWGVGLSVLFATGEFWWLLGALANTMLFVFVSLPMAERRQAKKEGFAEYKAETRLLLPLPKH